jgi:uncharacterized protein (DUF433 family)
MIRRARRHSRVSIDPGVMSGKPCVAGTRVPVELVLRYLAAGEPESEILSAFPGLTAEDIRACIDFAADVVADEAMLLAEA